MPRRDGVPVLVVGEDGVPRVLARREPLRLGAEGDAAAGDEVVDERGDAAGDGKGRSGGPGEEAAAGQPAGRLACRLAELTWPGHGSWNPPSLSNPNVRWWTRARFSRWS